jgi:hypothetical protein
MTKTLKTSYVIYKRSDDDLAVGLARKVRMIALMNTTSDHLRYFVRQSTCLTAGNTCVVSSGMTCRSETSSTGTPRAHPKFPNLGNSHRIAVLAALMLINDLHAIKSQSAYMGM